MRSGTLVDVSRRTPCVRVSLRKIIGAPSSTKNKAKACVDADSGIAHSLETTTAKTDDSQIWDELLHGKETSVRADKGCVHADREAAFTKEGDTVWGVTRKAPKGGGLDERDKQINRIIAKERAKVEHRFPILKRQFGHVKTRYRGLAKKRKHLFTLFALGTCS